jgi:hypothetical protein
MEGKKPLAKRRQGDDKLRCQQVRITLRDWVMLENLGMEKGGIPVAVMIRMIVREHLENLQRAG